MLFRCPERSIPLRWPSFCRLTNCFAANWCLKLSSDATCWNIGIGGGAAEVGNNQDPNGFLVALDGFLLAEMSTELLVLRRWWKTMSCKVSQRPTWQIAEVRQQINPAYRALTRPMSLKRWKMKRCYRTFFGPAPPQDSTTWIFWDWGCLDFTMALTCRTMNRTWTRTGHP